MATYSQQDEAIHVSSLPRGELSTSPLTGSPVRSPRMRTGHVEQSRFSHVNKLMSSQQAAAVTAWVQSAAQRVSQGLDTQGQSVRVQGAVTAIQRTRPGRFLRKFGPLILIITLLFAVKYLLLAIHLNVRSMKSDVLAQCNGSTVVTGSSSSGTGSEERADVYGHMEGVKNEAWRQHRMVGRGTYGYVQWSAYRVHDSMVVAVGLGSTQLRNHRKVTSCTWHSATGAVITGDPTVAYPQESVKQEYETIIIRCSLRGRVVSEAGGYLAARIDSEHVILYREERDSHTHKLLSDVHPYTCTFCTYPLFTPVDGARLRDWLEIHRSYGADHVVGYDAGGVERTAVVVLKPYVREGYLDMLPMTDVAHFDIEDHGKIMAMHDCLFRSVLSSTWVLFIDWDDLLGVYSPSSLQLLLQDHSDVPWMSYGCQVWATKMCLRQKEPGSMPQERMVYHWPHYLCTEGVPPMDKRYCLGDRGHRYIIASTQKVSLLSRHEVREPRAGGIDLSVEDVRHERFESLHLLGASEQWCSEVHDGGEGDKVEWWAQSMEVKERLAGVRNKLFALDKAKVEGAGKRQ